MTRNSIHFGTMSLVLALGSLQGVVVLVLLLGAKKNRDANRLLAALIAAAVLRIVPYIIGYAGFYDAYPWLSFAPYDVGLAFGPLVYLYVFRLTSVRLPRRWALHLVPALLQVGYYSILFVQPLAFKDHWDERVHSPWVVGPERWAILLSAIVYLTLSARRYRAYRRWLSDNVSYREDVRIEWIRNFLVAFGTLVLVWIGFATVDLMHRLDYFAEFPLYVIFTAFVYYLGLEGWRHAELRYPVADELLPPKLERIIDANEETAAVVEGLPSATTSELDSRELWQDQGKRWLREIQGRELWRDPDLSLPALARALGTNTSYLSKGLNAGVGQNFNECINRMRVASVQRALGVGGDGRDLLAISFDAGFRSKASFNRAFKSYTGLTPTEYRERCRNGASQMIKPPES